MNALVMATNYFNELSSLQKRLKNVRVWFVFHGNSFIGDWFAYLVLAIQHDVNNVTFFVASPHDFRPLNPLLNLQKSLKPLHQSLQSL